MGRSSTSLTKSSGRGRRRQRCPGGLRNTVGSASPIFSRRNRPHSEKTIGPSLQFQALPECGGQSRGRLAAGRHSFWKRTESWCRSAPGPPETSEPVQISGVWTPPEVRNRGYGRAVVAGALREAARDGVTRAVLFRESPSGAAIL
ncbi:GNAT family N-acetyltransferase [Mesorhizobium sp. M1B.F.Ca.ET.045.04.1.1]|nr:GNAT family N-acetyltransferase [Mesorhizobium sp. M1B.F.Ca.ET.045.04.1.1]